MNTCQKSDDIMSMRSMQCTRILLSSQVFYIRYLALARFYEIKNIRRYTNVILSPNALVHAETRLTPATYKRLWRRRHAQLVRGLVWALQSCEVCDQKYSAHWSVHDSSFFLGEQFQKQQGMHLSQEICLRKVMMDGMRRSLLAGSDLKGVLECGGQGCTFLFKVAAFTK